LYQEHPTPTHGYGAAREAAMAAFAKSWRRTRTGSENRRLPLGLRGNLERQRSTSTYTLLGAAIRFDGEATNCKV